MLLLTQEASSEYRLPRLTEQTHFACFDFPGRLTSAVAWQVARHGKCLKITVHA